MVEQLVLTIALDKQPDDASRQEIERFAEFLGDAVEALIGRMDLQRERLAMAECLLEPDFNRYEGLAEHSRLVSDISHRFATVLGLAPHDAAYVKTTAPGDAVKRLRDGAGTQFDATLVETFLEARREIVGPEEV